MHYCVQCVGCYNGNNAITSDRLMGQMDSNQGEMVGFAIYERMPPSHLNTLFQVDLEAAAIHFMYTI